MRCRRHSSCHIGKGSVAMMLSSVQARTSLGQPIAPTHLHHLTSAMPGCSSGMSGCQLPPASRASSLSCTRQVEGPG